MTETIPALMFDLFERRPDAISVHWHEEGRWRGMSWREGLAEVAGVARVFEDLGVKKGTPVAIIANTCREWLAVDLACQCLGAITVGVYPTLLGEQMAYQLRHSEARVCVVEDAEQLQKLESVRAELPDLEHVFVLRDPTPEHDLRARAGAGDIEWLRARGALRTPDDIATYIYTSGTTGEPKGAVLTQGAFVRVAHASRVIAEMQPGEVSIAWLPLAHSLQRFTVYRGFIEDLVAYVVERVDLLPEVLLVARPTLLAAVPRMLEKIQAKAEAKVGERGGVAKKLYDWAFSVGYRRLVHVERGERVPLRLRLRYHLADRLVFRRIRERLGGRLRLLVSGGAALNPAVARWYGAMGIVVLEGWGLTETCAPATCNREHAFRFGTVGTPLPGVELRIDEDGEILVKSPGLFLGYYKSPEATAEAFTDGWFRTGDLGEIDADGFLKITDRKKEIIVTAGGKNIAPVPIEKLVERSPYVGQAVVIGDERPYLVALLVPDDEALAELARSQGWPEESLAERLARDEVRAEFERAVEAANRELARFQTIKRWTVLPTTFSPETGELTPTLKLKRRVVRDRHADSIEALYE